MSEPIKKLEQRENGELEPGFKMTELGPLPEEWEVLRFGDLLRTGDIYTKTGFAQGGYNEAGRGVPQLRPFNIDNNGNIDLSQVKYVDPPPSNSTYWVRPEDIIFNNTNSEEIVGKTAYFTLSGEFVLSNHMTIIRVLSTNKINRYWLSKLFLYYWEQGTFRALSRRYVNQANVALERLKGLIMPLPPAAEQQGIAYVMNTVQRGIGETGKVVDAARELKKSLMRHLFTYGPVAYDQVDNVPLKETEIGSVPEHWEIVKLSEVAKTASGGTPSRKKPEYYHGEVPWVKSGELEDSLIDQTEEFISDQGLKESSAKIFPRGTLVIALYGATAGKVGILGMEAATNQAVCAIFPESKAMPEYLFYVFIKRRQELLGERYGGAQPNISQTILKEFRIPIPPLPEQQEIARILQSVDRKIEAEENRKRALETLFKTLLHYLMTGKIRVKDLTEVKHEA